MKTAVLFVMTACLTVSSFGKGEPAAASTNTATATIYKDAAIFWFPVKDADRTWSWGTGFPGGSEYTWKVKATLMDGEYELGYTKWLPSGGSMWPGTKGEGSLQVLLLCGQVDIWRKKGHGASIVKNAPGINAFREGEGVAIRLIEPRFLQAFLSEQPKQVVFESESAVSLYDTSRETVEITYMETNEPAWPGMAENVDRMNAILAAAKAKEEAGDKLREQYGEVLEMIAIPSDQLPEGWSLAPGDRVPILAGNPVVSRDPWMVGMLSRGLEPSVCDDIECVFSVVYLTDKSKLASVNLLLFKEAGKAQEIFEKRTPSNLIQCIHRDRYLVILQTEDSSVECVNRMRTYFEEKEFPGR